MPASRPPYTVHVEGRRKAGLCAAALLSLCLPGVLRAESEFYVVRIPQSVAPSGVASSISRVGDWEISVAFDATRCEIYCAYRRFGRTPLTSLMRPPIAAIQIWRTPQSQPEVVWADPAGLSLPRVTGRVPVRPEKLWITSKESFTATLRSLHGDVSAPTLPQRGESTSLARVHFASAPLRI
jgi:hypothetical protein